MIVAGAESGDLLDDLALLVDLDGEHPLVGALVVLALDGGAERFVEQGDPGIEQILDAQQQRHLHPALVDPGDDVHQRDPHLPGWEADVDRHLALVRQIEIAGPPLANTVEAGRIFSGPVLFQSRIHGGGSPEIR